MNIKILALSGVVSSILMAVSPMVSTSMSTDNGGTKAAIDAYSDGGGVLMSGNVGSSMIDNSAMNTLVFKYGEEAKKNSTTLLNEVKTISPISTVEEKILADKLANASSVLPTTQTAEVMPPFDNSCEGGYSGVISTGSITCSSRGLLSLSPGFLNLTGMTSGNLDFDTNSLSNVDSFQNLKTVNNVYLNRNRLSNINGLRNLERIEGVFYLYYGTFGSNSNSALTDLSPLNKVTFIGSSLVIENKNYSVKLNASSYICNHPEKVTGFNGTTTSAVAKSNYCNP